MARVALDRLTKTFAGPRGQQIRAVRDLTFLAQDNEFLVLAGPSGCGKTTTLRLIAGLERPSAGTISIDGRVVNNVPAKDRNVAMVFQNLALYPHMTAYENMAFGLQARKHPKSEISRRVEEAVTILALNDCLDRVPSALSGGQRQRLALARAIVLQPRLLLLDEPLSNLDAPLRTRMRAELSRLHAKLGTTTIYVTHDQLEGMALGDRIAILKEGGLQQIGNPLEIYDKPANQFVAGFLGNPGMNFFQGTLVQEHKALFFQELSQGKPDKTESHVSPAFRLEIPAHVASRLVPFTGQIVVLGIRPEKIVLSTSAENGEVPARLERVELLGAESHLQLSTGHHTLTVRCAGLEKRGEKPQAGHEVHLRFDLLSAHFFHPANGELLNSHGL
jgi:multiple sugar transport system ATP-binding protein